MLIWDNSRHILKLLQMMRRLRRMVVSGSQSGVMILSWDTIKLSP